MVQIPPDLVVKFQAVDIVSVICDQSGDQTSSNCRVETGNQGFSCPHQLRVIGLPLNAMECDGHHLRSSTNCEKLSEPGYHPPRKGALSICVRVFSSTRGRVLEGQC